ncbi:rhamnan synthesis F family protein [Enterococcus cecorum]|uniref:rhamnan synthesis F family protein n=1 Tax=Enterococcus cecorum TaxID=44008 RepID=UPI0032C3FC47
MQNFANTNIYIFDKKTECYIQNYGKVAVFVNLYYFDSLDYYCQFLNNIPVYIPIYIYSSQESVLIETKKKLDRSNCYFEKKNNRGRDISTLLVSAKNEILKYDYFCFIHDKKANAKHLEEDVAFWIENLWENTLASANYINQIIKTFSENERIGLLSPMEQYADYYSDWYSTTWGTSYDKTIELAKKLNIDEKMFSSNFPTVLGTVFWAKTSAMKKLFNYPWKYEDFLDEPLPIDGTISHAVERIIEFVIKDAGYEVGKVMATTYAAELFHKVQHDMRLCFSQIKETNHIINLNQLKTLKSWQRILREYVDKYCGLYLYGAGTYGKMTAKIIQDQKFIVSGFIVSDGHKDRQSVYGIPVYELSEIEDINKKGIIVAISYENREEIHQILESRGVFHYLDGI